MYAIILDRKNVEEKNKKERVTVMFKISRTSSRDIEEKERENKTKISQTAGLGKWARTEEEQAKQSSN